MNRTITALVAISLVVSSATGAFAQAKWAKPYDTAMDLIKAGQYARAIPLLEEALAIDQTPQEKKRVERNQSRDYFPQYYLFVAHLKTNQLAKARAYYNLRGRLPSNLNPEAAVLFGELNRVEATRAATLSEFESLARKGDEAYTAKQWHVAVSDYEAAKQKLPEEFQKRGLQGRLDSSNENIREEKRRAEAAYTAFGEGQKLLAALKLNDAKQKFQNALALVPEMKEASEALGVVAKHEIDYATAKTKADQLYKGNNLPRARDAYVQAQKAHPQFAERDKVVEMLAAIDGKIVADKVEGANRDAELAAAASAADTAAQAGLKALFTGDPPSAIKLLSDAVAKGASGQYKPETLHAYLGVAYATLALQTPDKKAESENKAKALDEFRKAGSYSFPPNLVSPRVRELFDEAKRAGSNQ